MNRYDRRRLLQQQQWLIDQGLELGADAILPVMRWMERRGLLPLRSEVERAGRDASASFFWLFDQPGGRRLTFVVNSTGELMIASEMRTTDLVRDIDELLRRADRLLKE